MNELSVGAMSLKENVLLALKLGPIARINTQEYADAEGITLRTAQRRIKELREISEIKFGPRGKGTVTIMSVTAPAIGPFLKHPHVFRNADEIRDKMPDVVLDVVLSLLSYLYIYIYIRKEDLREKRQNDSQNDTNVKSNNNGSTWEAAEAWLNDTSGEYSELVSMVCHVCKISALLLLEEQDAKIMQMFKAGIIGDAVYKRYGYENRPNFWWNGYWKGRNKHARPTIADIMLTWEQAADYQPQEHDSWPPYIEIVKTMEEIMYRNGWRKTETALSEMSEFGYDKIINHISGGYVSLIRMKQDKARVTIANAIREIRSEAFELTQE